VEGEHYRFAATPPTLRYGAGSANFAKLPIELDVLPGSPGQGDKTVVLEARFSSGGVNQGDGRRNSCPLSGQGTERYTVTITGSPAEDVRTTLTPVSSGLFLEGLGNTGIAEVGFQLLSGSPPGENCRVVADISADAARSTAVEGEHFRIVTSQVSFGNGDGVTKTEQVIVELLDDNDPGNDSRTLLLVSRFTTEGSDCAVTAVEQNVSITIGNDPEANLQAQLSAESYSVVEGNQVRITLSFQEEAIAQTSFAQRPTGTCEVAAEWRVDGLQPADYRFDAPEIIRYSPDTPEVAYTLTLHEDRQREGVESFDVSVRLSQSDNNPCPLAASLVNTTVNLPNRIALNDGALSLDPASARAAEPEEILAQTCDAIRSYASAVEGEDQVVQSFLTARLSDNSLSDTKRSELEDRRRFYIDNCWDRGSQIANDLRDRNFEPEEVVSQGRALLNGATRQLGNVRARLNKLRTSDGERGLDISGIDLNIQDAAIPSAVTEGALGGAAGDEIDGLFEETRWGAFVNGEYAFGDKNRGDDKKPKSGDRNFEFNSKGLTLGVDYRFPGERFIAGAALGYKDFEAEFSSEDGGTSNQGYNFSVYGTYLLSEKSYFDAVLSYGRNQVKTVRPINQVRKDTNGQPLLDQSGQLIVDEAFATGNPDADEITFSVGGGYDFQIDEWTITPYGRVDYIKGKIDAYKEESSTAFDNAGLYGINEQELESLSSSVGLKASKVISTSNGVFIPQASLEWKHEFKDRDLISGQTLHLVGDSQLDNDSLGVNADFLEDNSVNTGIDKDYFNINIGVSAVFPEGRSGYVNVESRLGDDTTEETAVKAGYRWEFF
ncbi:MAG: autotransporter outer membrane beta-barrel domain-containing protein, partial [Thiolinea sp.]